MKIGILSMQRVDNYGSFWQAYCLKKLITDLGNNVEFIDIIYGDKHASEPYRRSFSFSKIKRIPYYIFQHKKGTMFTEFQSEDLGCSEEPNYSSEYDAIFIGSDEVFNIAQDSPWGFSTQLYGDIDNPNVNSYAGCFGSTTYDYIVEKNLEEEIRLSLNNLKNISVRDENSYNIVKTITGREAELHLDPALIGDLPTSFQNRDLPKEKFILVYAYDFRFNAPDLIASVKKLARESNCKIYSVGFYQDWCDKCILTTPYELMAFFSAAEYVITDTFHGTIFAARCHRKFITVIRPTNKQKLSDLLSRIDLSDRIVNPGDDLKEIIRSPIDYEKFEEKIAIERARTVDYLKRCLKQ